MAGSAVGLLASTMGRLYASTYYALRDTRTPLRYAVLRVVLTVGLGYLFAIPLPGVLGIEAKWGAAGLTASAGIAGWVEFILLRRTLNRRLGTTGVPAGLLVRLWSAALVAAGTASLADYLLPALHPVVRAAAVLGVFAAMYFSMTLMLGVPEARRLRPSRML
jgi:putative peptidoglycan lipid II flippase